MSDSMSKVQEVDYKNAQEEMSPPNEEEQKFIKDALSSPGVDPSIFTTTDRVQIMRGYQTYDPRGKCTNEAFQNITEFRQKYNAHEFLRKEQDQTAVYNNDVWKEWIYPPDKYGHIHIAMKFSELDINALEKLSDDELTRLQAQRLAAYSQYKVKLSEESGVQRYKHTLIIDLAGSGMGILSGKKKKMVQRVMAIGSDFYPETVWKIYVINAPFIFRAAWGIAKAWVHPVTQAKINVLGNPSECAKKLETEGVKKADIPFIVKGPCKGKTSAEVIFEMIEYTLEKDKKEAKEEAKEEDGEEGTDAGKSAAAPARSPVRPALRGGRRTPQTTML
mmetsp:Transcript_138271/g.195712  ORF Transcript_138271/g.195712 Transcript_138271/m.195712 type:complete len:333 (-) Transcript_138271:45-1043(-)